MGDKLDLGWRILLSCTVPAIRFMMMIAVVMMAAVMMAAMRSKHHANRQPHMTLDNNNHTRFAT